MSHKALSVQCVAHKKDGTRCQKPAITGATVCGSHGANKRVRVKAGVRAEVVTWGLGDTTVDPGEVLLRLVTQSAARAERYAAELEQLVNESESLRDALIAEVWASGESGESYKAGEYVRGLARLEAEERDRCANFAAKAVAAGLAERQVRVAEQQGQQMFTMVKTALGDVHLTPEQVTAFMASLARQVRALE